MYLMLYSVLVGRLKGKRAFGRCRWKDNTKMDLQIVGWVAWTGLLSLRIGPVGGLL